MSVHEGCHPIVSTAPHYLKLLGATCAKEDPPPALVAVVFPGTALDASAAPCLVFLLQLTSRCRRGFAAVAVPSVPTTNGRNSLGVGVTRTSVGDSPSTADGVHTHATVALPIVLGSGERPLGSV